MTSRTAKYWEKNYYYLVLLANPNRVLRFEIKNERILSNRSITYSISAKSPKHHEAIEMNAPKTELRQGKLALSV